MRQRLALYLLITILISAALPQPALADGIIIIEPPFPCPVPFDGPTPPGPPPCPTPFPVGDQLEIKYHRVSVTIDNQIAVTKVDQLFYNPNDWQAEGMYLFPMPADAAVSNFVMWVDGKKVEAKILGAKEARQIYDDIVRQYRDPALLEYAGLGAVQASIFPIPPDGERRIQLEYSQVLTADNGLIRYVYPLSTEKFSAQPLDSVSVSVSVKSSQSVRAVYSPTHKIGLDRHDRFRFTASYEESIVTPDQNFELYYSVSPEDIGVNLISYRDPAEGDGFFVLLAAPGIEASATPIAKDVILVLDQSGSMDGSKIEQAKTALQFVLDNLNEEDRFNIVAFSTGTQRYASRLQPASRADEAQRWVSRLVAEGGTNIERALLEAMALAESGRPTIIIFLTDGLPTEGVTDPRQIIADVTDAAPDNVRLFAFGVGDDVDTILLDSLAEQNHGASAYVRPDERIDETVSAFYAKVSAPVLADLRLDFGEMAVSDLYPVTLPDLFAGSQLVVVGRYRHGGTATITLSGSVNGALREYVYPSQVFNDSGGSEFIPRLWATRKIGYLLNQIRLSGENTEWVQSIINLSVRYGIVTPYTSYLITEDDILTSSGRDYLAEAEVERLQAAPAPAVGGGAVQASQDQFALQSAESAAAPVDEYAQMVKIVGMRTFINVDGVWTDTRFDPSRMTTTPVQFASDDYFALVDARPDLASAFALGARVIALSDGLAYEVIGEDAPPITIPPTVTPDVPVIGNLPPLQADDNASPPATGGWCASLGLAAVALVAARRKKVIETK